MLDKSVSLGIVELILHPSESYTEEHNDFVKSIPPHVKELVRLPPPTYHLLYYIYIIYMLHTMCHI